MEEGQIVAGAEVLPKFVRACLDRRVVGPVGHGSKTPIAANVSDVRCSKTRQTVRVWERERGQGATTQ